MLCIIGYAIAGIFAYESIFCNNKSKTTQMSEAVKEKDVKRSASTVVYHIKSGEGEISLPSCKLIAVELGLSVDPNKATLQIMVNKSVETECKPITDIEKKKKHVKLTPTQYQTNIVFKTKKKGKVPITAYYSA